MENKEETFRFTYSAEQQAEVEKIRQKYIRPEADKMTALRKLDLSVTQKAQTTALVIGILGALILGAGMSLIMTDLGALLESSATLVGILVGLVGLVLVALAYPVYNHILKKERQRIAPEILRLTDELLHQTDKL